jgi:hypothetical protein
MNRLYQNYETEISKTVLETVFSNLQEPLCILGGWAVFITVNKNFLNEFGYEYHGSKDIDLGFHINPIWSKKQIEKSVFNKVKEYLIRKNFTPSSHSYIKWYHTDTRSELTEEQSKRYSLAFIFQLFVDFVVDQLPDNSNEILGFTPIDEPLLTKVFKNKKFSKITYSNIELLLPKVEVLLGTKINSVINRQKDHKRIKDICDIFALILFSDESNIDKRIKYVLEKDRIVSTLSSFSNEDFKGVSKALGINNHEIVSQTIYSFLTKVK